MDTQDLVHSLRANCPRIDTQQLFKESWLIVWDGRSVHAKAGVTEQDIDGTIERLEHLRSLIRQKTVVQINASGRVLRPGDDGYINP